MQSRNLKIESTGDYFAGKIKPKIRLQGQWLEIAGFTPGNRVAVHIIGRGFLALRFLEKTESSTMLAILGHTPYPMTPYSRGTRL